MINRNCVEKYCIKKKKYARLKIQVQKHRRSNGFSYKEDEDDKARETDSYIQNTGKDACSFKRMIEKI